MCATCGCGDEVGTRLIDLSDGGVVRLRDDDHDHDHGPRHDHDHDHGHSHDHDHGHAHAHSHTHPTETLSLEMRVLAKNDELASENRTWLADRGVFAVNLMSSPGSGKTTLLERTVRLLDGAAPVYVVEGDQETTFDAERIRTAGAPVVQINTGAGCHLDAAMLRAALQVLDPADGVVLIENVGNLVCPALFDLGESARVVIMSVTEGADKPLKYPHIFASATLILLNKIDLLPYVDFDVQRFERDVRLVNPAAQILHVCATQADGLAPWQDWLGKHARGDLVRFRSP